MKEQNVLDNPLIDLPSSMIPNDIGVKLGNKRKAEFVQQKKIVNQGYSQSVISDFENGKTKGNLELINVYAKMLNLDFYELVFEILKEQRDNLDGIMNKVKSKIK